MTDLDDLINEAAQRAKVTKKEREQSPGVAWQAGRIVLLYQGPEPLGLFQEWTSREGRRWTRLPDGARVTTEHEERL